MSKQAPCPSCGTVRDNRDDGGWRRFLPDSQVSRMCYSDYYVIRGVHGGEASIPYADLPALIEDLQQMVELHQRSQELIARTKAEFGIDFSEEEKP
jgi:hypothetical protein